MEKNQKNFDALQAEREELRLLIGNGISFTVNYQEAQVTKVPRWANWLGKIFKRKVTIKQDLQREYIIKEPTLFTLDRLSAEYIELKIDEQKIKEAPRQQSRLYLREYDKCMAKIIAIAVLGNDWEDNKQLESLTAFLFKWLKPSQLNELSGVVDLTNNLADFINSIRLMSSARTTMPNLIEETEQD
jgi:hypothetical protein